MSRMFKVLSIAVAAFLAGAPLAWAVESEDQAQRKPKAQFQVSAPATTPEMDAKMADAAAQLAFEIASEVEQPQAQPSEVQKNCHAHKGSHAHPVGSCQKGCNHSGAHDGKSTVLQGHCPKSKS